MYIISTVLQQNLQSQFSYGTYVKKKLKSTTHSGPTMLNLSSSTTAKSNLYFARSVATAFRNPVLHEHLMFNLPDFMYIFCCLYPLPIGWM